MIVVETFYNITDVIEDIRREIFIDEQGISEKDEFEGGEGSFIHFCMCENGIVIGYARVHVKDHTLHVGRIAVRKRFRQCGNGKYIVSFAEKFGLLVDCIEVSLNAQIQAQGFYEKLGYAPIDTIFLEAGIEHIKMIKPLRK